MFMLDCTSAWLYELALWRTPILLPIAGGKIADWLKCVYIQCDNLHVLKPWSVTASGGCVYDDDIDSDSGKYKDIESCLYKHTHT